MPEKKATAEAAEQKLAAAAESKGIEHKTVKKQDESQTIREERGPRRHAKGF